jgi:cysteinylglycine-S-conjugate dipeptidase
MHVDEAVLGWFESNYAGLVRDLAALTAIQSISTDRKHQAEIGQSADLTCAQMRQAGLQNVAILKTGDSNPYAYGEWLGAPGKPTVFLYAHHDVQPTNYLNQWESPPWELTRRDGRLFARGSADDKGAITAQLAAVSAFLKTHGKLPVNIKMVVEGEEEIGSTNLLHFFKEHKARLQSDVIVVCDTENIQTGVPSLTYALRGIVALQIEVRSAKLPVHSGMAGGALADSALALSVILSRLFWDNGKLPIPHYYDRVRPMTAVERKAMLALPGEEAKWREDFGIGASVRLATEKGVHLYEQTWRKPAVTVIAMEASTIEGASNQVLPTARAIVSGRIVPDQDPDEVYRLLADFLTKDPPWGVEVHVEPAGPPVKWWMTDPQGPAFEAAMSALRSGYGREGVGIGCGGTIGFVGPLADLFGGAPALLLGIEDERSNAHAPNESLDESDWKNLMRSLTYLFGNLGNLPHDRVK